jgi:hypothetical protein
MACGDDIENVVYIRSHSRKEARINCSMWFSHNQSAGRCSFHPAQMRVSLSARSGSVRRNG